MVTRNTEQFEIGPAQIKAGGTELGYTRGDLTVTITTENEIANSSQSGSDGEEVFEKQVAVSVKGEMFQIADMVTLLGYVSPGAYASGDKISWGRVPGYRSSQNCFELTVHPEDQTGTTKDFTVYRAYGTGNPGISYGKDGCRVIPFEFKGLYDDSNSDKDRLCSFGNSADETPPTITSVAPTDGAASQAAIVNIVVTFNEAMSKRSLVNDAGISSAVVVFDQTNEVYVACAATVSTTTNANDTLTLNPDASLTASATIDVIVTEHACDSAGNAHAGSHTDFAVAA